MLAVGTFLGDTLDPMRLQLFAPLLQQQAVRCVVDEYQCSYAGWKVCCELCHSGHIMCAASLLPVIVGNPAISWL